MVLSWQQHSGTLVVGGNSSTVRLWDLGREQCVSEYFRMNIWVGWGYDVCLELAMYGYYFFVLLLYSISSGALGSPDLLLPYSIITIIS